MSYDIVVFDKNKEEVSDFNVTYNLSQVFVETLKAHEGLNILDNMKSHEAIFHIIRGMYNIQENFEELRKHEPENGWGRVEDAYEAYDKTLEAILNNPGGYIRIL